MGLASPVPGHGSFNPRETRIFTPLCRIGSWGLGWTYSLVPGLYGSLHLGLLLKDPRPGPEALNASETPGGLILSSHSFTGKKNYLFEGLCTEKLLSPSSRVTKTCWCSPLREPEFQLNQRKYAYMSAHPFSESFRMDHQVWCAELQLTEVPVQTG